MAEVLQALALEIEDNKRIARSLEIVRKRMEDFHALVKSLNDGLKEKGLKGRLGLGNVKVVKKEEVL